MKKSRRYSDRDLRSAIEQSSAIRRHQRVIDSFKAARERVKFIKNGDSVTRVSKHNLRSALNPKNKSSFGKNVRLFKSDNDSEIDLNNVKNVSPYKMSRRGANESILRGDPNRFLFVSESDSLAEKQVNRYYNAKIAKQSANIKFINELYEKKKVFTRTERSKRSLVKRKKGDITAKTRQYTTPSSRQFASDTGDSYQGLTTNKILATNNDKPHYYTSQEKYDDSFVERLKKGTNQSSGKSNSIVKIELNSSGPSLLDSLFTEAKNIPKSKRLKTKLGLIFYNDAKRPPTESEYKSGNREGVYYARYVEYGFTTKIKTKGENGLVKINYVSVPGKHILLKVMKESKVKSVLSNKILDQQWLNIKYTKEMAANMLGEIGDEFLNQLKHNTPKDTGLMSKSWGWIIDEQRS